MRSLLLSYLVLLSAICFAQEPRPLPTSKSIRAAGEPISLTGMPLNIALSPDGRFVAILNDGYGSVESGGKQSISVLDRKTESVRDFPDARLPLRAHQVFFLGMAFSSDGTKLFASFGSLSDPDGKNAGSTGNGVAVYAFANGAITPIGFLKIPMRQVGRGKIAARANPKLPEGSQASFPAGMAVVKSSEGDRLLVANNLSDDAVLMDAGTGTILHRFDLSTGKVVPSAYPYGAVVTKDGTRCYVSLWNASQVAELDLRSGAVTNKVSLHPPRLASSAGSHPTAMLLSPDDRTLYVALANTDEVATVDTQTHSATYISVRLPGQSYGGAFPNALAMNAAGSRLYVALAGANAIAVVNIFHQPTVTGFLPTEWYPTALAVDSNHLYVASAKGKGTGPNIPLDKASPCARAHREFLYIECMLKGSVTRINIPVEKDDLRAFTARVLETNGMLEPQARIAFAGGKNPIRHVVYIIKENRSYDQVFGDLGVGNGDPSLVLFGNDVTPNQHRLAREFGVLDNFYDSGEVSGSGHNWSTSATASDYLEKTLQLDYRGEERTYDYEGQNASRIPLDDDEPDVNEPGTGYLWGAAARHKLTYRHYGEFVHTMWCPSKHADPDELTDRPAATCAKSETHKGEALPSPWNKTSVYPWPVPIPVRNIATKPELRGHFNLSFPDFNTWFPDQLRADEFLREFRDFVQARVARKGVMLPNYVILRLPNDHTTAETAGAPTPAAAVADNDLAVGRVVDAISHSPYWDDTAILVLEDDAQDGADHVDAHRSIALVISKYSPSTYEKPLVDSTYYTTVSMIRTLETLLGLPPMNNNDAHAPVMAPLFRGPGDHAPFTADDQNLKNGLLFQTNAADAPGAKASAQMDFRHADSADTATVNAILWRNRKGNSPGRH